MDTHEARSEREDPTAPIIHDTWYLTQAEADLPDPRIAMIRYQWKLLGMTPPEPITHN